MTALATAFALLLGALTWSFLEYCIHRWLGHDRRFRPNFFAHEHVRHHAEGDYFAPTIKKLAAATVAALLLIGPAIWLAGPFVGSAYVLGTVTFYGAYELLHRLEHTHAGWNAYGRWARRHHLYHHFEDARFNHGVTSPIWDLVFGTYRRAERVRVPRRLAKAFGWLLDADGEIKAEHTGTYELKGKRVDQGAAPVSAAA